MLVELAVSDLGVIAELSLLLGPGMTALTGETGAGKTLVVTAIELLVGGRADSAMVRPGAPEARVEGRFITRDGDEVVLSRSVPAEGRSRAYIDGRMAPVGALAELGRDLVDLHGQHAHQSLLSPLVQRRALDRFGPVDTIPLSHRKARVAELDTSLALLGGEPGTRQREMDFLRFQLDELDRAGLRDPREDEVLEGEEDVLADAVAHRDAGLAAGQAMTGEDAGSASDALASAIAAIAGRAPFADIGSRLRVLAAEVAEAAVDLRGCSERIEPNHERLEAVRARRDLLRDLERKYAASSSGPGGGRLADVMAFAATARSALESLESHDQRVAELAVEREEAEAALRAAGAAVLAARRQAAPRLAAEVVSRLRELAMPRAEVEVAVEGAAPGDDVTFLLSANPGEPVLPLAKVASGGELARAMLALRLVLSGVGEDSAEGSRTLIFDEVDAGVGGEAALSVGRALAALGRHHQVLVVTHLAQVAAFADAQVGVWKSELGGRTVAAAQSLEGDDRVAELGRMLSGQPDSSVARRHAEEMLVLAGTAKARDR